MLVEHASTSSGPIKAGQSVDCWDDAIILLRKAVKEDDHAATQAMRASMMRTS